MERTLYINGNEVGLHVVVDGPSLLIKKPQCAERRIPFNLISSVVIFGDLFVKTSVLTTLSEYNIPILFISKWAKNMNISVPIDYSISAKCSKIEKIFKDAQKVEEFRVWARAKRVYLQTDILRKVYYWDPVYFESVWSWDYNFVSKHYRDIIEFLMPTDKEKWITVRKIVKVLFWNAVMDYLLDIGFDIHCGIIHTQSAFGLIRDCLYILATEIDYQALKFFKTESVDEIMDKEVKEFLLKANAVLNIVNRFENLRFVLNKVLKDIKDKLDELIIEK
jgi:hypothetical protein